MVARRGHGHEPWYVLTSDPVTTVADAWRVVFGYACRWQIEQTWRFGKSELAMESPRIWTWERRLRLLMMVTVGYAFLLSLLAESMTGLRGWLLHRWCHRTGTRLKTIAMPLYRLRAALSHLWVDVKLPSRISLQNSG